jgi:hypothetical protein
MLTCRVSTDEGSNPGLSAARFRTDRIIRPAPTSSTTASDSSTTTSPLRSRRDWRPSPVRADSFNAPFTSTPRACRPGARPTRMPHATDTAIVNAATRRSMPGVTKLGRETGLCLTSADTAARARSRPPAAPISVSTQLSVISWRSSRPRPAPSAVRRAISRRRASDRAMRRLATLAHAISSTKATAAIRVSSAGFSVPNSSTSSGLAWTARFSFVFGYSFSSCREMPSSSACAVDSATPGFSRASAANPRVPRSAMTGGGA